jgi:hypothetical protein
VLEVSSGLKAGCYRGVFVGGDLPARHFGRIHAEKVLVPDKRPEGLRSSLKCFPVLQKMNGVLVYKRNYVDDDRTAQIAGIRRRRKYTSWTEVFLFIKSNIIQLEHLRQTPQEFKNFEGNLPPSQTLSFYGFDSLF